MTETTASIDEEKLFAIFKKICLSLSNKELVLKGQWAISGNEDEINIIQVESNLNIIRSKTGQFKHKTIWRAHSESRHPLGKDATKDWNRAYLKMIDLLHRFPQLKTGKYPKLRSLHLCESPGNFVAALADSLEKPFEWRMNSFNPHYEFGNDAMVTDDALILGNEDRMFFGENNSGNIFKLTKNDFEKLGKVDLVTADGSFDCTENPEDQEKMVCSLLARETFLAMAALDKGGNFIIKIFTFFRPETREILQRIIGSFEEVYLRKPAPSKPGNSEVYVIALGFLGEMKIDESSTTLMQLDTASVFFANKQIEMISFNLDTLSVSQFFKCQIEEEKQKIVAEFMEYVPVSMFWEVSASKKPFFPIIPGPIDTSKIHLFASPFVCDSWLRQRKILALPFDALPETKQILNPLLAIFDENYPMFDFCQLQNINVLNDQPPQSRESAVFILSPWTVSRIDLISRIMLILSDAEKIIIQPAADALCGILSRFSLSIMAILLDSFEIDGMFVPGNVILMKRKRPVSQIVIQFLSDVLRQQRISEVLCFIPLNDLSENFRMLIKYYNGFNFYYC